MQHNSLSKLHICDKNHKPPVLWRSQQMSQLICVGSWKSCRTVSHLIILQVLLKWKPSQYCLEKHSIANCNLFGNWILLCNQTSTQQPFLQVQDTSPYLCMITSALNEVSITVFLMTMVWMLDFVHALTHLGKFNNILGNFFLLVLSWVTSILLGLTYFVHRVHLEISEK